MTAQAHPLPCFIRDCSTGRYLARPGGWTSEPAQAKSFASIFQALEFCCEHQWADVELVMHTAEGDLGNAVPLAQCLGEPRRVPRFVKGRSPISHSLALKG